MRIKANGRIGIGTSSPVANAKVTITPYADSESIRTGALSIGTFGGGYGYLGGNAYSFGHASDDFKNIYASASVGMAIISPMRTTGSLTTGGVFVHAGNAAADTAETFASFTPAITWDTSGNIDIPGGVDTAGDGDYVKTCGFAGTVRPQQPHGLAPAHGQADVS